MFDKKKPKPKKRKCHCGCGLWFIPGRTFKYAPDCETSTWFRYRGKQAVYQSAYKKTQYKKVKSKVEKKPKRATCSCGCGRPVGKELKMLADYCYKKGSDLSEQAHWHTRKQGMGGRR